MHPDLTGGPVLRVVAERALAGSRQSKRTDGARVALAVEGGGMAGAVSAGMCVALEALGLLESFDVIYGSSAGAINASYAVAGQARTGAGLYLMAARHRLFDLRLASRLRPPFRLAEVGNVLLQAHPHLPPVLQRPQRLRLTAARLADKRLDVLGGFASLGELHTALWASCANPVLTGDIINLRGRDYVDGGLIESVPFRAALREGATHVLVLRSRHAGYRAPNFDGFRGRAVARFLRDAPGPAAEMVFEWPGLYNADACELEAPQVDLMDGRVTQLTPPPGKGLTSSYETRPSRLRQRIALGMRAVFDAFAPGMHQGRPEGWLEAA